MAMMQWIMFPVETLRMMQYYDERSIGRAMQAASRYFIGGVVPEDLVNLEQGIFDSIRDYMDGSLAKYDNMCERNKRNRNNRAKKADDLLTTGDESLTTGDQSSTTGDESSNHFCQLSEKRREENRIEKNRIEESESFLPPTPQDVLLFCQQEGLQVDAERFVNYYTASGWYQGSTPIRDWRACVRNWHRGERKPASGTVRSAGEIPAAGEAKPSPIALQAIQRMLAEEAEKSAPQGGLPEC